MTLIEKIYIRCIGRKLEEKKKSLEENQNLAKKRQSPNYHTTTINIKI